MTNIKIRIEPPIAEETEEGTTIEEEEDLGMGDTLATGADKSYQYTFTANNPPLSKGANLLDIKPWVSAYSVTVAGMPCKYISISMSLYLC